MKILLQNLLFLFTCFISSTTAFSPNQTSALQSNSFTVRSIESFSDMNTNSVLNSGDIISFSGTKQWYKTFSSGDGSAITGIQKIP